MNGGKEICGGPGDDKKYSAFGDHTFRSGKKRLMRSCKKRIEARSFTES